MVGATFERVRPEGTRPRLFHVRAVVDHHVRDGEHRYHLVLRTWSARKGWIYVVESEIALMVGLYTPRVRQAAAGPSGKVGGPPPSAADDGSSG